MDQIKIGKFIQERRKNIGLTQMELAEKLNISDRAVSKWENGVCMPDVSIIIELCSLLNISVNDLFSGEKVDMKNNEKKLEENLLAMTSLKEEKDKMLLLLEWIIAIIVSIILFILIFVASYIDMSEIARAILIITGFIIFLFGMVFALRIEQVAGYYECKHCHHKYIPTYNSVLWAMHFGRTRYMKCPNCNKRSWQRKVLR